MIALALLAAPAMSVADAERGFAAMAQREGQWTAFRANAAPEGVMFAPEMIRAHDLLAKARDPKNPIMWWPARTITSCDGTLAISTGPWVGPGGKGQGTFTTVWKRQADGGWKWLLDSGRDMAARQPAGESVLALTAACQKEKPGKWVRVPAAALRLEPARIGPAARALRVEEQNRAPAATIDAAIDLGPELLGGASEDGTLDWSVQPIAGGPKGAHILRVWYREGGTMRLVLVNINGVNVEAEPAA